MSNTAKDIITPVQAGVFRTIFLYVGQGDATLHVIPDGTSYRYVLVDTNKDEKAGGIDIAKMLNDLLDDGLDVFINTHPHKDHLNGISEIHKQTPIGEVWHSGHVPGKDDDTAYQEMRDVIKSIGGKNEYFLFGTNSPNKIRENKEQEEGIIKKLGDIDYIVLSPAQYVAEDVDDEDADGRRKKIHERCGVIKFYYGNPTTNILITGDSDKKAWKEHITDYHKEKLPSEMLRSSHHGSRSFFKEDSDDNDIYEKHIENISPSYIVVSAPKKSESRHKHPHDDAMKLYEKHLKEKDNLLHLGKNRECVIMDILSDGTSDVRLDKDLVKVYGFESGKSNSNGSGPAIITTTTIDRKPSGNN